MLIVLEGCDGVGKTTVANELAKKLEGGAEIIHCTRETPNTYEYFQNLIYRGQKENIILDRAMYGQFVYQEHNERNLTMEQLHKLEQYMEVTKARVFYVVADRKTILDRLAARQEKLSLPIETILSRYEKIFANANTRIYVWDTTNSKPISIKDIE